MNATPNLQPNLLHELDDHCDAVAGDALPAGAPLLDGAYEIVRVLGRGGFGITYEACNTRSKHTVALKEFFPTGCRRHKLQVQPQPAGAALFAETRLKFLSEARVLARVHHSNIVHVQEAFEANNTAYTVMELLQGETLLQRVERQGALPEEEALSIIEDVCSALHTVHELEMLHLDVKPENIFLCRRQGVDGKQRIVLMDFDLLQPIAGPASYRTRPLNVTMHCGTPGYAPLEQYTQGTRFGFYTDIYGLGATLYHVVTGQVPPASTDRAAQNDSLPMEIKGASRSVRDATRWAMQLQPFKRPQVVRDFLDALHDRNVTAPDASTHSSASSAAITAPNHLPSHGMPVLTAPLVAPSPSPPNIMPSSVTSPTALPVASTGASTTQADDLWYIVSISGGNVEWPWMCACCGTTPVTTIPLRSGSDKYEVPYCAHCARHVRASRQGVTGGAWAWDSGS
jgi:serine/threonine protein kinase